MMMPAKVTLFCEVILWNLILRTECKRDFIIMQTEFLATSHHPDVFANATLNQLAKNNTSIDLFVNITRNFTGLSGNVMVALLRKPNERFILFNRTNANLCGVMKLRGKLDLLGLVTAEAMKYGHLPFNCPPVRRDLYYVRNFSLNADMFPPYIPEARFEVTVEMLAFEGKKKLPMLDLVYNGEFKYKHRKRVWQKE